MAAPTGSALTRLIVLRGNSAAGKSTVAAELRRRYGRGIAVVAQDNLRRVVLREKDVPGGANIGLIETTVRYALDHGYHVVVEGIFHAARYGAMLTGLLRDHRGVTGCYYLDVSFTETLRRHAGRPQADEFGEAEMSGWYAHCDLIAGLHETVVGEDNSLVATVEWIAGETGLMHAPFPIQGDGNATRQPSPATRGVLGCRAGSMVQVGGFARETNAPHGFGF